MTLLVIGNAALDHVYSLEAMPAAGASVLARVKRTCPGGKGLNQAVMARRDGGEVVFCTAIGGDPAGTCLRACLHEEDVTFEILGGVEGLSDESVVLVTPEGDNRIVTTAFAAAAIDEATAALAAARLASADTLLLQGNLALKTTIAALETARRCRARTLLNAAPVAFAYATLWPLVDIAILNEVEMELLGPAVRLLAAGVGTVVTTCGAAGVRLAGGTGDLVLAAPEVRAIDTSGAGDVFCGVLAAGLARGLGVADSARRAVVAASWSVMREGTLVSFPTRAELMTLPAGQRST